MEANTSVSSMIMYEDESVDVRYVNGAQLQLSPCGSEFLLVKEAAPEPALHPLQPRETVRQRTRFTISTYKELLVAALAFRNRYASRPYLPEELIPTEHKQSCFSLGSDVTWPEFSSCEAELGPGGETVVRSEEGRAALMLSPSGEDFTVAFTCRLSQSQNPAAKRGGKNQSCRSTVSSPLVISPSQSKSTTVVQHHSCSGAAPAWHYPLSLARRQRTTHLSKSEDVGGYVSDTRSEERRSCLPRALALTCPAPHWHRWKSKRPLAEKEESDQDLPPELVKVMWCQGVTYRILSGAVAVIEVSPGDGSVIRSNGVLNTYFTHHRPELQSGQVKEILYHLKNLPPDVVGEAYSIFSVVNRASRILSCYTQAKHSLKLPVTPSCLQEAKEWRRFSEPSMPDGTLFSPSLAELHVDATQTLEHQSNLVAGELEKIKRFNFLLENSVLHRSETGRVKLRDPSAEEEEEEEDAPVREFSITEALRRTSRAIQDIEAAVSAATLT
ncbi:hypothetical protein JOB18_011541 [Solea senegalensis]|uniref:DUF4524 domain-containing protein n=2 Tax=Solea senegalensis TaxID=28829 RepID=A0AAV6QEJ8_SOLSE|nr:uncharacterized protein C5orf34 homolog isoform X1 [Solea senegalensis]KAG7489407.1 hypothetical protein JOB18_011541 [Solea senegalensis]